jgi:radical SAM protein with 4Fe4S-binding SPASM domain
MERIFDQLYYDRRFRKVGIIHLHNAGEALLHPEFRDLVRLIALQKKRFKAAGYNFPQVAIVTNATILKPYLSDFIIESGVFDYVRFSMDGGTPETFEQLRLRANWNNFYENVSYFLKQRKKQPANLHTSLITMIESDKKRSIKWMHPQFQELFKLADSYEIRYPHNWRGEVDLNDSRNLEKNHKLGCSMLIKQLVILPNGDVTICCSDLNSQGVIGNINDKDLYTIYNSPKRLHIVEMLYRGKKHLTDLCKDCPTY